MDALESARVQTRLCNEHRRKGWGCACCDLEDHCHTTRNRYIDGDIFLIVDEEHFRIIDEWRKKNEYK